MASSRFVVAFSLVVLAAVCHAAPQADKQADVEAVPLEGPEGVAPPAPVAPGKDLKTSSSYGFGYGYPFGYGLGYGYGGYPYGAGYGYGLGYGYYPKYYYGGYGGYPYF